MGDKSAVEGISLLHVDRPEDPEAWTPGGELPPAEPDWIGLELREYYDEVLREPVPNRLLALVNRNLAWRMFH